MPPTSTKCWTRSRPNLANWARHLDFLFTLLHMHHHSIEPGVDLGSHAAGLIAGTPLLFGVFNSVGKESPVIEEAPPRPGQ